MKDQNQKEKGERRAPRIIILGAVGSGKSALARLVEQLLLVFGEFGDFEVGLIDTDEDLLVTPEGWRRRLRCLRGKTINIETRNTSASSPLVIREKRLAACGLEILRLLESREDWGGDELQEIAGIAQAWGLAEDDEHGNFKVL